MRCQKDVRRLEVAMDDAAGVERRERASMSSAIGSAWIDAQRAALQPLGERLALEQLHRDEELAVVFADLVDLADVRMVDAGRGARFAPEALARRLVAGDRGIIFSATVRPSRSSSASYTTPMRPARACG